jgi:O-antigen ligase
MDSRLVLALWAAALAPLPVFLMAGRGLDRGLVWSIRIGIGLLFFVPFVITTDTLFPFIVGKALVTRGVIEIVFAMWVVLAVRRPEYRPARSWLTLLFAAFLAGNLVAALTGVSFTRSFWSNYERMQGVADLAHWFALFVVMLSVIRGRQQWLVVFNVVVGVGLVEAFLGVAQRFDVRVISILREESRLTGTLGNATYVGAHMAIVAMLSLALVADSLLRGRSQPAGTTAEPRPGTSATTPQAGRPGARVRPVRQSFTGLPPWAQRIAQEPQTRIIWPVVYCTIWAIVLPAIAIETKPATAFLGALGATAIVALIQVTGRERLLWAFTAALAFWILGESASRGAAAALGAGIVGTAFIYAVWGRGRRLKYTVVGLALLVVVGGATFSLGREIPIIRRLAESNQLLGRVAYGGLTENARVVSARIALEAFAEDPITGFGPENFFVAFRKFQRPEDFASAPENQDQTHNRPLDVLSGTGLIGIVPWVGMWSIILFLAIRSVRRERDSQLFVALLAGTAIAYLVHLLWLFETANAMLLFVTIAAWVGTHERAVSALPTEVDLAPAASARSPRPSRRDRRAARDSAHRGDWPSQQQLFEIGLPLAAGAVVLVALFGINWRIQRAAFFVVGSAPLDEIPARLNAFPPLGTIGRTQFAEGTAVRIHDISPREQDEVIAVVTGEIDKAIAAEPQSILVRLSAARFFASASQYRPELVERARLETNEALRLGPHTHEAHARAVEQAFVEKDLAGVRFAVERWKTEHPNQDQTLIDRYDTRVEALAAELAGKSPGG